MLFRVLIFFLAIGFSLSLPASQCSDFLTRPTVWTLLESQTSNGEELIQRLAENPTLGSMYIADAGVKEGYTIQQHTAMVLKLFHQQYDPHTKYFDIKPIPSIRLYETLKMALALHDIGKPLAILENDKHRQHEFTVPILIRELKKFGFNTSEIRLAEALVENDILGDLAKDKMRPAAALFQLQSLAQHAGLSLQEYLPLQILFYTADAGSYPKLYANVFKEFDGTLLPDRSALLALLLMTRQ